MNQLQIFDNQEFGQVRTLSIDGKPYAVGSDVAKALGYAIPHKAVKDNCPGVLNQNVGVQTGFKRDGSPAMQDVSMLVIPEPDIYRLIFKAADQSISPEIQEKAEKFQNWIFEEVIPAIRKTGSYGSPQQKLDFNQILQLAKLIKNTPRYKLPLIHSLFKSNGFEIDVNNSIKLIQEEDKDLALVKAFAEAINSLPITGQEAYQKFKDYCKCNNHNCISAKCFVGKMRDVGFNQQPLRSRRYLWVKH